MIQFDDIKRLLTDAQGPVLSLYLQIDPSLRENQATTPAWRIWLKNALRDIDSSVAEDQRDLWQAARNRAVEYIDNNDLSGRGLMMFIGEGIERIYHLPLPVPEPLAAFGPPSVAPALWLIDEYEPYLIVLADSEEAQFITTYLGDTTEQDKITSDRFDYDFGQKTMMPRASGPRAQGGGKTQTQSANQRDRFDDMIATHVDAFYRDVVSRIQSMLAEKSIKRLILGGSKQSASAIRELLDARTRAMLVDTLPVPVHASAKQVYQTVMPVALEHERKREEQLVQNIINTAKADGRAVLGRDAVLSALEQKRVELLVAPWPLQNADLRERLPLQALEAGSAIEMVYGEAAERIEQEGGLAARLYFTV